MKFCSASNAVIENVKIAEKKINFFPKIFSTKSPFVFKKYRFLENINYMRPGATKGTLRKKNENSFFDVLCFITFHWSFKTKI